MARSAARTPPPVAVVELVAVDPVDPVELVELLELVELVELSALVKLSALVELVEWWPCVGARCRRGRGHPRRARVKPDRAGAAGARAQVRAFKGLKKQTAAEQRVEARAWRARGKEGVATARRKLAELTLALRTATRAAREVGRYVAPGARAAIEAEARAALDAQRKRHAAELRGVAKMARAAESTLSQYKAATAGQREAARQRAERAAEILRESDDQVRNDLNTDDERLLFELVRTRIQPTSRMTRTEAFWQWCHDNASNISSILARYHEEQAEREWQAMANARNEDEAEEAVRRVREEPVRVPAWMRSERPRRTRQATAPPAVVVVEQ